MTNTTKKITTQASTIKLIDKKAALYEAIGTNSDDLESIRRHYTNTRKSGKKFYGCKYQMQACDQLIAEIELYKKTL